MEFDLAPPDRKEWVTLVRAVWLHLTPVLFHAIDCWYNTPILRQIYHGYSESKLVKVWACLGGYLILGSMWENASGQNAADTYRVTAVSKEAFMYTYKGIGITSCIAAFRFCIELFFST